MTMAGWIFHLLIDVSAVTNLLAPAATSVLLATTPSIVGLSIVPIDLNNVPINVESSSTVSAKTTSTTNDNEAATTTTATTNGVTDSPAAAMTTVTAPIVWRFNSQANVDLEAKTEEATDLQAKTGERQPQQRFVQLTLL